MVLRSLARKIRSFRRPPQKDLAPVPEVGDPAPARPRVGTGNPRVIVFLRHIGCAFGEATLDRLEETARRYPDVEFLAITHGDETIATDWCAEIGLGTIKLEGSDDSVEWCHDVTDTGIRVFVDADRSLYADWGLGRAGWLHLLHPRVTIGSIKAMLAGFRDRETSGNRWQQSGMFAIDENDVVRSVHVAETADDLPNFDVAVSFLDVVDDRTASIDVVEIESEWEDLLAGVTSVTPEPADEEERQRLRTDGRGDATAHRPGE